MPIIQAFGNAAARAYGLMASGLKRISDAFNRSNNASSLGTTDTGQVWENIRGTWGISSNKASTSTSASTYPIAAVQYGGIDATIIADVQQGSGISFWINDTQNWWGVAGAATGTTNCTGTSIYSYSCCGGSTSFTCTSSSCSAYTCDSGFGVCSQCATGCTSWALTYGILPVPPFYTSSSTCVSYGPNCANGCLAYTWVCNSSSCSSYTCTGGTTTFTCTCGSPNYACSSYAISYSYRIDLIKSVANTVTTVATQALSSALQSIKIILNSSGVVAKAYSSTSASGSEVGSITNAASGAGKYTKHGIILISSDNQSTTVDNFSVDVVQ